MPELPEVETVRRVLAAGLVGSRVRAVQVRDARLRQPVDSGALEQLVGASVVDVRRRAKYVVVELDSQLAMVIHLGMSGTLTLLSEETALDRHDHVRWWFQDGSGSQPLELRFRDPRRFGLILALPAERLAQHVLFAHLGPDPLESAFSGGYMWQRSRRSKRPVKNFLMDSTVVTGIGNIYASESLWRARIHPATPVRRIAAGRWGRLRDRCVDVLQEAIREGGTTLNDFRDPSGSAGYFAVRLRVYGREGAACPRCQSTIRRIVQAGRSTFYCPACQH